MNALQYLKINADLDAMKSRAEKAEAENQSNYSKAAAAYGKLTQEFIDMRSDRDRLKAENERLREALREVLNRTTSENIAEICIAALGATEGKDKE